MSKQATSTLETKWCSWHQCDHPITEFGIKDRDRGIYQSKCRTGQREYSRRHYAANAAERRAALNARSAELRPQLQQLVDEARSNATCVECGRSEPDAQLTALCDSPTPRELVRNDVSLDVMRERLAAADLRWRCKACIGGELGGRRLNQARAADRTLRQQILDFVAAHGEVRANAISDHMFGHAGSKQSLWTLLSKLVKAGDLARVRRGIYRIADDPRPW